jgi:hypothetical protein
MQSAKVDAMKHRLYEREKTFVGRMKYYLYDRYSGTIRRPKRSILASSNSVITIGEWQNHVGDKNYNKFSISIYEGDALYILDSDLILNLSNILINEWINNNRVDKE